MPCRSCVQFQTTYSPIFIGHWLSLALPRSDTHLSASSATFYKPPSIFTCQPSDSSCFPIFMTSGSLVLCLDKRGSPVTILTSSFLTHENLLDNINSAWTNSCLFSLWPRPTPVVHYPLARNLPFVTISCLVCSYVPYFCLGFAFESTNPPFSQSKLYSVLFCWVFVWLGAHCNYFS